MPEYPYNEEALWMPQIQEKLQWANNYRKLVLISSIFWAINSLKEEQTWAFEINNLLSFTDQNCTSVPQDQMGVHQSSVKSFVFGLAHANPTFQLQAAETAIPIKLV